MEDPVNTYTNAASCNKTLAFRAIKELVEDLRTLYPSPKSPLALYNRLIQHVKDNEIETGSAKFIAGFQEFFNKYARHLDNTETLMENIPPRTVISFGISDKIFIDIHRCLHQANDECRDTIRLHLLTIATIMEPDESALTNLTVAKTSRGSANKEQLAFLKSMGFNTNSKESEFMVETINEIQEILAGKSTSDPAAAMMQLAPLLPKVMSKLKDGVQSGAFDMANLMKVQESFENNPAPDGMPSFSDLTTMFANVAGVPGESSSDDEDIGPNPFLRPHVKKATTKVEPQVSAYDEVD